MNTKIQNFNHFNSISKRANFRVLQDLGVVVSFGSGEVEGMEEFATGLLRGVGVLLPLPFFSFSSSLFSSSHFFSSIFCSLWFLT